MTHQSKDYTATFRRILGVILILSIGFVFSCDDGDDDPEPEGYELPGIYTFKEAILQTPIVLSPDITIPAGFNLTSQMAGALLATANCVTTANGAVELKSDYKLFFVCLNESTAPTQAGVWSVNTDTTKLSLDMAKPPLPTAISLDINDLTIDEVNNVIGGRISNFPITSDLYPGLPAPVLVDVDIKFQKQL